MKSFWVWGFICLVLGVVYGWLELRPSRTGEFVGTRIYPDLDQSLVSFVELEFPGERWHLSRHSQGRFFKDKGFTADPVYVESLLRDVAILMPARWVGDEVADHYRFHLDARGRRVRLFDGDRKLLVDLVVGTPGKNYRAVYFRKGEEADVFYGVSDLYPDLNRPTWVQRRIWSYSSSMVPLIEWNTKGRRLRLGHALPLGKDPVTYRDLDGASAPVEQAFVDRCLHFFVTDWRQKSSVTLQPEAWGDLRLLTPEGERKVRLGIDASGQGFWQFEEWPEILAISDDWYSAILSQGPVSGH